MSARLTCRLAASRRLLKRSTCFWSLPQFVPFVKGARLHVRVHIGRPLLRRFGFGLLLPLGAVALPLPLGALGLFRFQGLHLAREDADLAEGGVIPVRANKR